MPRRKSIEIGVGLRELLMERLTNTDKPDECWTWIGLRNRDGYGRVDRANTNHLAHRLMWQVTYGEIPQGLSVLHHCDNPPCCNPRHLFLGTQRDNVMDAMKKGRLPRGTTHGNTKLTPESVRTIRASSESSRALGKRFGVHRAMVKDIRHGRTWRHLL